MEDIMIKKYIFGQPIETEAVVKQIEAEKEPPAVIAVDKQDGLTFTCKMEKEDVVYGLGENVRGINKRGWLYESRCCDQPVHTEDKNSMYASHNFIMLDGERKFGLFFDYAGIISFDVG